MRTPHVDGTSPAPTRWRARPDGSNWGDFGADDTLGRLNLVGAEQVRKGVAEVRDGRVFCLSLPLDRPRGVSLSPHRLPPIVRPTLRAGHVNFNCDMSVAHPGASDVVGDDLVVLHTQYSTQWDAFGHVGARFDADTDGVTEKVFYNGWRAGIDVVGTDDPRLAGLPSLADVEGAAEGRASSSHAGPVDISHMARHGVQGRAVLIDLEAHFGADRTLVRHADLASAMRRDGVTVEAGDFLLLHTGFARSLLDVDDPAAPADRCAVLDGTDRDLHAWIRDTGIAAIAADNHAVEAFPPGGHRDGRAGSPAARAVPVPARHPPRRAVVVVRARRAPQTSRPFAGPPHRSPAAAARSDRIAADPHRHHMKRNEET